ncbi:MAG: MGH1-like glycoside hydrolase domain-containing protein, partial [Candidatus Nanopelagicales bacterium]
CKQFYNYHVYRWLAGDPTGPPPPPERWQGRNSTWQHIVNEDLLLMPDAWEYPWYAAWDLGFHAVTIAMIDPAFAKQQCLLMLSSLYQHPHGEVPAYEWDFSNANPPVLAWAVWQIYLLDAASSADSVGDVGFLATAYRQLLTYLSSWLNTKDPLGKDLYAGGFLGMDNIGIFNRDHALPTGGQLVQSDGTAWVAHLVIQMAEIALELNRHAPGYPQDIEKMLLDFAIVTDSLEHGRDGVSLWNHDVGFYCDAIVQADGSQSQLGVISMQALIPLFALATVQVAQPGFDEQSGYGLAPELIALREHVLAHHPEFRGSVALPPDQGDGTAMLFAAVRPERLERILARMLDPEQLLGDYGIRSMSATYRDDPYVYYVGEERHELPYWPAESRDSMFGGNSNWRGPIWFPINLLLMQSLLAYDSYFGDTFKVEYPAGSGVNKRLFEVVTDLSDRMCSIFVRGEDGRRVVFGTNDYFQTDPHWRDLVPFYEYFDGDDGHGVGASHQTGWTACVAILLQLGGSLRLRG